MENISANYWLILCFLITDLLPVSALFPVDVICYILLCSVTAFMAISYMVICFVLAACK